MAKKIVDWSWAYTFGPYEDNPVPFDTVVKRLSELEFDGVEIGRLNRILTLTTIH